MNKKQRPKVTKQQTEFIKKMIAKEANDKVFQQEATMLRLYTETLHEYLTQLNDEAGTLDTMLSTLSNLQENYDCAYKNVGSLPEDKYKVLIKEARDQLKVT
ncbi:hypothetical protein RYX56_05755 [Alkalihalophilus lindianensis]|uniref:Uncharacterized protein n=1 Tax=Alkalihalophilus lindianensis TaxID=1630542 RepID=A0ABU3X8U6_9BACI|nr:hypothetical protein [Alkalihalophilus lindianensis]MDV2683813.1 hypothetical protein [Alkalihalophilus lindianensis]MDV2683879.1 hypothetical protein [Alkalihalophilus lindianensis]